MINQLGHIYEKTQKLIVSLRSKQNTKLANVMEHRMKKVSWTCADELIVELKKIITAEEYRHGLSRELLEELDDLLNTLSRYLESRKTP